jgi:hypothetical protein
VSAAYRLRGRKLMQWFQVSTFEGKTTVRGLPIKVPAGVDVNQVVQCEVAKPVSVVPADLNGDGWYEQVIVDGKSAVSVCDTALAVAPVTVTSPFGGAVSVYPVDVRGDGVDQLFIGSTFPDGFNGQIYSFVTASGSYDLGKSVNVSPVFGTTVGCIDIDGDGKRDFAFIGFSPAGDANANANQTGLTYSATAAWPADVAGTVSVSSNPGLPLHSPEAVRLTGGYCGDRLIMTG